MRNSNLGRLISNYVTRIWGLFSVFLFIPIYIKYLGVESYAIIGFYALMLGIVSFADAGMSSAITKEFSKQSAINEKYSILKIIEKKYILVCVAISLFVLFFSDVIAKHWLKSDNINIIDLANYVKLIGIGVSLQILSSLYFGGLFGLNKQFEANSIQFLWSLSKSALVVPLLILIKPSLTIFLFWQVFCNLVYILILRFYLMKIIILEAKGSILTLIINKLPKDIIQYIGGMTIIAVIASINSQIDKIMASTYLSLKVFGYYSIASNLAQIPVVMATPLALSVFPLFSKYSSTSCENKTNLVYKKSSFVMHLVLIPVFFSLYIYSPELIILWVGNVIDTVWFDKIIFVMRLLLIGSFFLGLQFLPYYFLLSKGKTSYTIYQGLAQILVGVPLLFLFAKEFGILGLGWVWVIINLGALLFLNIIVFKKFLNNLCFTDYILKTFFNVLLINGLVFSLAIFINHYIKFYFLIVLIFSVVMSVGLTLVLDNRLNRRSIFNVNSIVDFANE
ncbi:oligosaccharide flippase family protein [Acinetobacter nosocomialis]|uniref:oligosaccharide flippase family protein n=1 Tax=Acinetobacter nosocomialis TaxID=106654 RepID=UPI000DE62C62|nr:oligosaccharide flippase family protein [Acinetobacter nosocomialis]SSR40253.1 colanic acid exporter [Acinetobacter baumannii]MBO8210390.1 oligosaccharide flippase family protein [Acinetobacter nosocomialis]MBO8226776.1 oligosaccharide flippase family protein [Acinetobacter nosocomialis]MBO8252247.1 oligosaccharide flippase family protein [Acinetobacter nosocomialis]MBR7691044.1 oligosaccharide flippase family protein [Acinetobacter nosocomialis]